MLLASTMELDVKLMYRTLSYQLQNTMEYGCTSIDGIRLASYSNIHHVIFQYVGVFISILR